MSIRLVFASVIVLAIYGATLFVRDRGMPTEPASLEMKLGDLPTSFACPEHPGQPEQAMGEWKGELVAQDPEMFKATGAAMTSDRIYHDQHGRSVLLHTAVYDKPYMAQGLWHPPELCYLTAGWRVGESKTISLPVDPGKSGPLARNNPGQIEQAAGATDNTAKFFAVDRHGETAYVLYWYQIEGKAYCTGDRQRQIVLGLRGRTARPPVVKAMLHVSASSPEDAEKTLLSLATGVFAWTRTFH